jgi:hypothetical protein
MTPVEHVWEIGREYGYREFAEAEAELRSFVSARCATSSEGPKALVRPRHGRVGDLPL